MTSLKWLIVLGARLKIREQEKIFDEYSFILPLTPLSDTQWQAIDINGKTINVRYSSQQGLLLGEEIEQFTR